MKMTWMQKQYMKLISRIIKYFFLEMLHFSNSNQGIYG